MHIVRSCIAAATLALGTAGSAEHPRNPRPSKESVEQILQKARQSYEGLIEIIDHPSYHVRAGAQKILTDKAVADIIKTQKTFTKKSLLAPSPDDSLERTKRLHAVRMRVEEEEIRMDFRTPSIFRAPESWKQKEGAKPHTVTMETALRVLSAKTDQPLSLQYTSQGFLGSPIPTAGLDGKGFWDAFRSLKTATGYMPISAINSAGALTVHPDEHDHWMASSGKLAGFLREIRSLPGTVRLSLDAEPVFQIMQWDITAIDVRATDGRTLAPGAFARSGKKCQMTTIPLPRATKKGEVVTITLHVDVTVCREKKVPVHNLAVEQIFEEPECTLQYLPLHQSKDKDHLYTIDTVFTPFWLHQELRTRIGCIAYDEHDLPINHTSYYYFNEKRGARWNMNTLPTRVYFVLPGTNSVRSTHTLVFPNVPLHQ